jgi:hypothetical protein
MDKPSERKKDHKEWGDTDIGVQTHSRGKIEQMDGLWHKPTTITGGSAEQRLRDSNYCKMAHEEEGKKKETLGGLLDKIINDTSGPPYCNTSKPQRVF